jgi:predicted ribosome quality control (RQC) complex YloA/Tae2 family protein
VRGSGAGALAVWGDPEDRGDGALGVDRAPGYTPNDSPGYSPNDSPGHSPGDTQGHSPDRPTLGNPKGRSALPPLQEFIGSYYGDRLRCHEYQQLHHQLRQRVRHHWTKAHQKATGFRQKLEDSALAEDYRYRADLIMAHLHQEPSQSPSPSAIVLKDFATGEPVTLTLNPEKNWVQNAQGLYRQHQKLKRAAQAVAPLLAAVEQELQYLEQVESLLEDPPEVPMEADWLALQEIAEELQQEGYGSRHGSRQDPGQSAPRSPNSSPSKANKAPSPRSGKSGGRRSGSQGSSPPKSGGKASHRDSQADFHRYHTPNGLEILVGRNNRQNDALTFRVATSYDLWFHTQEIPGSHVLLRLQPGQVPDGIDLQHTAHVAAYHSRARHSDRAPVVYTEPRHVYKPKGAGPGLVIYKHERILWGSPHQVQPLPPQDL